MTETRPPDSSSASSANPPKSRFNMFSYIRITRKAETHPSSVTSKNAGSPTHSSTPSTRVDMLSNVLAIIGSIILIVIIIWGLLHLASLTSPWFSSLFKSKPNTTIVVTAPATATSGTPITVSWKYTPSSTGSYAFLYQCQSGLQFATPAAGNMFTTIPCGAAYTIGSASSSIAVLPLSAATSSINAPITIVFIPSATSSSQAQGSATIKINPSTAPVAQKSESKPAVVPTKTQSTAGPADLSVRITLLSVDQYGNGTATFEITNVGGSLSGTYYFTAELPTSQPYTYNSPAQMPLAPGSYVANTLHFTQGLGGIFTVTVSGDTSTGNNTASEPVSGPSYNTQYPNQYGY